MNNKLTQVREAIIKAVPEIKVRNTSMKLEGVFGGLINYRDDTIRLSDVLIATNLGKPISTKAKDWVDNAIDLITLWNPHKNDINLQEQELIDFIHPLIVK